MRKLTLHVNGLVCDNLVRQLHRKLNMTHGVERVKFDTQSRLTCIECDETVCPLQDVMDTFNEIGYQVDEMEEMSVD